MPWTPVGFGKHSTLTLPQIIFKDPDWFFWAIEQRAFDSRPTLAPQAREIDLKARAIKIPSAYAGRIAQYVVHRPTGKIQELNLIEPSAHRTEHATYRNVIDLSVPREFAGYDKSGCHQLIRNVKFYVFGAATARMTRQRCEAFFDDDDNFALN
jgi:hypothetical protein